MNNDGVDDTTTLVSIVAQAVKDTETSIDATAVEAAAAASVPDASELITEAAVAAADSNSIAPLAGVSNENETSIEKAETAITTFVATAELQTRDVVLGVPDYSKSQKTNILLQDLIYLERILWKLKGKVNPTKEEDLADLVSRFIYLVKNGKPYELAGLKHLFSPFMKSSGRFMTRGLEGDAWRLLSDDEAKHLIAKVALDEFSKDDLGDLNSAPFAKMINSLGAKEPDTSEVVPDSKDIILLKCSDSTGEKAIEQYIGNKSFFNLASQHVTSGPNSTPKRVRAASTILDELTQNQAPEEKEGKESVNMSRQPRFLLQSEKVDGTIDSQVLSPAQVAEFCVIFAFEVFLEKEIHVLQGAGSGSSQISSAACETNVDIVKPGIIPIRDPTDYDVLFGRGGMTNSHPGNRRFRDVIALHRPDYIRALKMDKPAVAKKIVKAIRLGDPPGRFLKKNDDGRWYDVGDRTACEKTSQGLRERTNAEKRQRSALREALKIRKQDMPEESEPPTKVVKVESVTVATHINSPLPSTANYVETSLPTPLSPSAKPEEVKSPAKKKIEIKEEKSIFSELKTEGLPPNAVDKEGNILVTDYDILCGRGGLTNHHKGNKRFRDIVALHRSDYVRAPKIQKPSVARVIVRAIRNGDPPGRFLKKNEKTGKWYDVGDKKAAEKTSQALREKTVEEREKSKPEHGSYEASVLVTGNSSYVQAQPVASDKEPSVSVNKDSSVSVPNPVTASIETTNVVTPAAPFADAQAGAQSTAIIGGATASVGSPPALEVAVVDGTRANSAVDATLKSEPV